MAMQSGYNINDLVQEAQIRWLKPAEVLFILQNYKEDQLKHEPPQKPTSGSLFLFNKRVLRFFRRDGHSWRKKKDGRTVGEAHERLKVGTVETLNCYYAHGEQNPNFQRRSYWMLDPAYEHIVLVHYREISEGGHSTGSLSRLSPASPSSFSQSPSSFTAQRPGSTAVAGELHDPYQSLSSPGSTEVSSGTAINGNGMDCLDGIERKTDISSSPDLEVSQALRKLEEQLSLNDDSLEEIGPFYNGNETSNGLEYIVGDGNYSGSGSAGMQDESNNLMRQTESGDSRKDYQQLGHEITVEGKVPLSWKDMLEFCESSPEIESQEKHLYTFDQNEMLVPPSSGGPLEELEHSRWMNFSGNNAHKSLLPSQDETNFKICPLTSAIATHETNSSYFATFLDQNQIGMPLEADSSITIAQKQKFTIREISPEWGYASEATKVIVVGSFLCDPLECPWTCMFGEVEVPLQIIQGGVVCCHAPPHLPGNVTFCITSGNRESCSEVREFEYRIKPTSCAHCSSSQTEAMKSPEELLLLVRFVQMLLSDPMVQKGDNSESEIDMLGKYKAGEDSWGHVIEALLVGSLTSTGTTDWLLQELMKDKLPQWLSLRSQGGHEQLGCSLSRKQQGIIHMIAGLGFEWALNSILKSGVNINFRDINGWTALHWAARFGREKMVAALVASGASAGAITDPNSQDPIGKTAASIAAESGHKGLAGYLSEVALTSHLSSLKLEESELSKNSADVEAEITVESISNRSLGMSEDQLSLKHTLAAVRNAAQAAARIQSAFRAHSFRKRQQLEAPVSGVDEYGIPSNEIEGISAVSKLAFGNARDYNMAALSIQKKYRGWKGRKDFLALRQKVVKIQAHVRGHQVRKNYKVICWAVGILEKVILRWRRRGVGLRGYRPESESINESEDEDIVKVFRKQSVEVAIDEAVSRVLSMVESPTARQQYRRMLLRYRQAKAELGIAERESTSQDDVCNMENDDVY